MKFFYLCEKDPNSHKLLVSMVESQPKIKGRSVECNLGDFNLWIDHVLNSGAITDKTATFALLDQRSTECDWSTVEKLACHKGGETKIELFYFFPTGWVHRAISAVKDKSVLDRWWGCTEWTDLLGTNQQQAHLLAIERIKGLGYRDVKGWPISSREEGEGRTMYHMIHATDHLEAPKLMYRAYNKLIRNEPVGEQPDMFD